MVELTYLKIRENIKLLKYGTILEVHILYRICVSIKETYDTKSDMHTPICILGRPISIVTLGKQMKPW